MSTSQTDAPVLTPLDAPAPEPLVCPACSTEARRANARFCSTCGRALREQEYLPTDTLRSSYHQQHRHPPMMPGHEPHRTCISPRTALVARANWPAQQNNPTLWARAFVTYALVPYLGILFCPGAIICGVFGLLLARRTSHRGNTRTAARAILLGFIIFGAQAFFWWILYLVPLWARP
jgi:hypothetical protein